MNSQTDVKVEQQTDIVQYLSIGRKNAVTGRELAKRTGLNIRTVNYLIETARRNKEPICASARGSIRGYYIAEDAAELEDYCNRLGHRELELATTRLKLVEVLKDYSKQMQQ